jgi:sugar/nucleoside kinase (ribokinase family)
VGGIGAGVVFALDGDHDIGRNESRPGRLLDARDYCKLHIAAHYPAVLLGARPSGGEPGFRVLPVGRIGADPAGRRLRQEMEETGMDTRFVDEAAGEPTLFSVCFLYPDGSGGNITTSASAAATLSLSDVDRAAAHLDARTIALAVAEAPLAARLRLLEHAAEARALRVAAFTSAEMAEVRSQHALRQVDLLALNEDESSALVGAALPAADPRAFLDRCAGLVTAESPAARIVVTAGRRGAWGFEHGHWSHAPALAVPVESTAGAGDAMLGGVLCALALGVPLTSEVRRRSLSEGVVATALDLGTLVAAFAVTSPHTIASNLDLEALLAFASAQGLTFAEPLAGLVGEAVP